VVEDFDDIGVLNSGSHQYFGFEASFKALLADNIRAQYFDCNRAGVSNNSRPVDRAHTALAKFALDAVGARYQLTNH
jgi:hypothetical protein